MATIDSLLGGSARARGRTPIPRDQFRLSVLIPVFDEEPTIERVIEMVRGVGVPVEIICVNDKSRDRSGEILDRLKAEGKVHTVIHQPVNRGKGAAIRTAIQASTGSVVIVQDADLEYDPADYPVLLGPILDGRADAVYGSRFLGGPHRVLFFWHYVGNRLLTLLSNMITNLNLTDMETGAKAFRTESLRRITLRQDRFGFEPEITAKLSRAGARLYETPVSYAGRTYAEGKKITWADALEVPWVLFRARFLDPL
ncbi:MAG: glycosyltransferase family 2 protein [Gemmatimonadetes bacterium]|nr:glycosyltransferase family 2 protein [Gemmatimonadota bacterium]